MGQNDEYIKLAASIPGLKDKINVKISGPSDVIYWYIKFNIPLDETSVSRDTMNVTDREGYILETEISYNKNKNLIVIVPLDTYEQNEYYLLNIKKKVRSEKGNQLKTDIHILFKLKGNVISEFKILPSNVKVPKPKKRAVADKPINTRVYSLDKDGLSPNKTSVKKKKKSKKLKLDENGLEREQLPLFMDFPINPALGGIGVVMAVISAALNINWLIIGSIVVAVAGLAHIVLQITRKKFRTLYYYNKGVISFNKGNYVNARMQFDKALIADSENDYAEYARNKTSYYL